MNYPICKILKFLLFMQAYDPGEYFTIENNSDTTIHFDLS